MIFFNKCAVGVEVTPSGIYMVALEKNKTTALCSTVSTDWFSGKTPIQTDAIANAIKNLKIKTNKIATSIPGNQVTVHSIKDENSTAKSLLKISGYYTPILPEYLDIDCLEIAPDHFLIISADKDLIDGYITVFKKTGIKVDSIESNFFSLMRAFKETFHNYSNEAIAVINVKQDFVEIFLVKSCIPVETYSIPVGLSNVDVLAERVCARVRDKNISTVLIVGCGYDGQKIEMEFRARLEKHIVNLTLLEKFIPPGFEVAYGLALRQIKS